MVKGRIAFVFYPRSENSARLETMPFAYNLILGLAMAGWNIDLFLWESPSAEYQSLPGNVALRFQKTPKWAQVQQALPLWIELWPTLHARRDYEFIIGGGEKGCSLGAVLARRSRCPFVFLSDEFPSGWRTKTRWSEFELKAGKSAALLGVPDKCRLPRLREELGLGTGHPGFMVPNAPETSDAPAIGWHERLGLPPGTKYVLHAGSLGAWTQLPEVMCTVPDWPDSVVLLIHSRNPEEVEYTRRSLAHLDCPGKIFWSHSVLSASELNSLVRSATANLALYHNTGPNIKLAGLSSGKLARSLVMGTPVLASAFDSFRFVRDRDLGELISHPREVSGAIARILRDESRLRAHCLAFAREELHFQNHWPAVVDAFKRHVGVDLNGQVTTGHPSTL